MDNFDLRKYLAEGKLNENMFDAATTGKIAQAVADAFSADDKLDLKYVVNPRIDAGSFDLDVEAGPNTPGADWKDANGFSIDNYLGDLAGGSFYIKDGVVYNAASRNAPVANVTPEGEVKMISAADSRAAISMEENKEDKKSNKMKKSELKEMIRAAMLAETSVEETLVDADQDMADAILNALGGEAAFEAVVRAMSTDDAQTYLGAIMRDYDIEMDPAGDIPGFEGTMDALDSLSIREEEEDVEDVEIDTEEEVDVDMDMDMDADVEDDSELSGNEKEISDSLEAALEAARKLGDEKLVDQIGNTITFFTRAHIVNEELNEETNRMQKIAGIKK